MNVLDQVITDRYAIYNGDACELLHEVPSESIHLSIYSPPFAAPGGGALYHYSSSECDLSNARSYEEFFLHFEFLVHQIFRVTLPGRLCAIHCMDVPSNGANLGGELIDFPGDIIRLHKRLGFRYVGRYHVWKEPLGVRNRTMAKGLTHRQVVEDSSLCDCASADYLLMFRKKGDNPIPITHPHGILTYAGSRQIPQGLMKYKGWKGNQIDNRYSHWIWRQYASAFWDDVRIERVLPYKESREPDDEKHMHPLQLDVIERCCVLWSNEGETVLTPFMGVGSEIAGALMNNRRGIGMELKPSYFKQAKRNLQWVMETPAQKWTELFREEDLLAE
jgi:DNA modification methylase